MKFLIKNEISSNLESISNLRKLYQDIEAKNEDSKIVMDFEGIESMNIDFANEYLKLKQESSFEVEEVNVSDNIQDIFNMINKRGHVPMNLAPIDMSIFNDLGQTAIRVKDAFKAIDRFYQNLVVPYMSYSNFLNDLEKNMRSMDRFYQNLVVPYMSYSNFLNDLEKNMKNINKSVNIQRPDIQNYMNNNYSIPSEEFVIEEDNEIVSLKEEINELKKQNEKIIKLLKNKEEQK